MDRYGVRRGNKRARDITRAMEDPNLQDVPIVKQLREILDSMRDETNVVRAAMGKDPIGYVENYVPHIEEISRLNKLFEAGKASHGVAPDFIRPGPGVNPRAMQRRGAVIKREMDIVRLLDNYINASARDMFNSPMIKHLNGHSAKMREYGLNGLANGLDYQTKVLYSGKAPPIAEVLNSAAMENPAFGAVRQGVLETKSRLNKAIFTLNPVFTLFTQPLSGALTIKRAGVINSAKALRLGLSPHFRAWGDQNFYSLRMKGNTYGSIRSQDVGGADATMTTDLMSRTKIGGKAAALSEYATAAMEREISMHAAAAHYIMGTQQGIKGRDLLEFVSDGVAKTQSMYNFADLPGFLQERDLTAIALPFQTYAFELMNQVREMNIPAVRKVIGKTGQYANVSARSPEGQAILDGRMKQIVRWSAVIVAQQTLMNALDVEQDVFNPQSSIPFYSFIFDYGRGGGRILPKQAIADFNEGIKKYVQYGDWRPMRKFMLRYIVRGGIQANRMITGYEAVAAGGELDSRGVKKFKVKEDERFKAMLFGPYGTEGGKAYIDKLEQQDKNQWKRKERTVTGSSDRGRGDGARGGRRDSGRGSNR
ncbi:MAG: hypothetical protein IPH09_13155 [bacterium]|nr:hypothetical protein [bacterium]